MCLFNLIPASDWKQALRVRRFLIAAGTSLMVLFLLAVSHRNGLLARELLLQVTTVVAVLVIGFYALLRSGLNLRLRDPSLTVPQIVAATLTIIYVMYHAERVRDALLMVYLLPFLFGVFQLDTRRLLALALFVLLVYAGMVMLSAYAKPASVDAATEVTRFAALATVLSWFAVMGGYIQRLRGRLRQSNLELRNAVDRIQDIALRDDLTGVFNRRYLSEALRQEQTRSGRSGAKLALCIIDLDHFKSINDRFGHASGDAVLRIFAGAVQQVLRGGDIFGRFGGEEFLLVLPQTTAEGALASAERVRENVARTPFPALPGDARVTVTIGVTMVSAGEDISEAMRRADQALYRGKAEGRNRVVFSAAP